MQLDGIWSNALSYTCDLYILELWKYFASAEYVKLCIFGDKRLKARCNFKLAQVSDIALRAAQLTCARSVIVFWLL